MSSFEAAMRMDAEAKAAKATAKAQGYDIDAMAVELQSLRQKIKQALTIAGDGSIDGSHHKMWVIDQMVRALATDYAAWVKNKKSGEDGPDTYTWDEGIAP